MLTNKEAMSRSSIVKELRKFPESKKALTDSLFAYYKELLYREPSKPIPTVRRMF